MFTKIDYYTVITWWTVFLVLNKLLCAHCPVLVTVYKQLKNKVFISAGACMSWVCEIRKWVMAQWLVTVKRWVRAWPTLHYVPPKAEMSLSYDLVSTDLVSCSSFSTAFSSTEVSCFCLNFAFRLIQWMPQSMQTATNIGIPEVLNAVE